MVTTIASEGVGVSAAAPVGSEGGADASRPTTADLPAIATHADFDRFCREEFAAVTGLAFVLTGRWTVAEDLAQDAFLAAYQRWDEISGYDKPGAWVRRAVANRSVSWRRRLRSEAAALTRLSSRSRADAPVVDIPERHAEVWAAVRRLPPRQAQVFALTYVEDLPLARVAEILDISVDTAKTHLRRARAALSASGLDRTEPDGSTPSPAPEPGAPR
jgi:RNA polymerase sigma-70 factor (ECF subfamily)